jgi:hypothetical protein
MASSSSHNNSGIPLATLLEWYKIRDTCFGQNYVSQNIPLALELAGRCQHPDARWLTEACAGKNLRTKEDGKRVFSALGQGDARALCFTWLLGDQEDLLPLRRSAELGFAFAQASMALKVHDGTEKLEFALLAAAQGERDGFFWLAVCYREGYGGHQDFRMAKENFFLASELGEGSAMLEFGHFLDKSDPQRWKVWGRAASFGVSWKFLFYFGSEVELFISGTGSAAVMFAIGQVLRGNMNEEARTIFNEGYDDSFIRPAKQAIAFYEAQIKATKNAMRASTLVGIRWKVVKDVRKMIAKLLWDSREEALFKLFGSEQMAVRLLPKCSTDVAQCRW